MEGSCLASPAWGYDEVAASCEHSTKLPGIIKGHDFFTNWAIISSIYNAVQYLSHLEWEVKGQMTSWSGVKWSDKCFYSGRDD
jgi:hypothetical protein